MRSKSFTHGRSRSLSDPLAKALLPPPDETPEDRERRLRSEQEAQKVSDAIDEQIKLDRQAFKKQKQAIKVLLLGQSESGKSTTLKQFQLLHTPAAFHAERIAWRAVIYLNLIRSIRRILDALLPPSSSSTVSAADPSSVATAQQPSSSPYQNGVYQNGYGTGVTGYGGTSGPGYQEEYTAPQDIDSFLSFSYESGAGHLNGITTSGGAPAFVNQHPRGGGNGGYGYTGGAGSAANVNGSAGVNGSGGATQTSQQARFEKYAKRLAPLMVLEQRLMRQLSFPEEDDDPSSSSYNEASAAGSSSGLGRLQPSRTWSPSQGLTPIQMQPPHLTIPSQYSYAPSSSALSASPSPISPGGASSPSSVSVSKSGELALRTTSNWKKSVFTLRIGSRTPKSAHTGEISGWWEDPDDPVHVLNACAHGDWGMVSLWKDKEVRNLLSRKRVRMEESSGFYLNEIERITAKKYIPTDDDVLKARLKTLGVVEHAFTLKGTGPGQSREGVEWKIYDVGGARYQRQAWAPYFEDINAIIFLAPISAFDQTLAEDARVNRLEDSMLLWRSVVSNKLLGNVNIILFLNKCDLLKAKLDAGVSLAYHMTSYRDRANDYESVSKYFYHKFGALHLAHTPNPSRDLYIHLTSVTDKLKTSIIISNVRDLILKQNLQSSRLI